MLHRWSAAILVYLSMAAAYSPDHITQVLLQKCSGSSRYTYLGTCFKLDLLRLMSLLGNTTRLPLAPGVALVGTERTRNVAEELDRNLVASPRSLGQLDHFIWAAAEKYLGSLNLTVQLKDSRLIQGARGLMTDVIEALGVAGYATVKSLFSFLVVWYYECPYTGQCVCYITPLGRSGAYKMMSCAHSDFVQCGAQRRTGGNRKRHFSPVNGRMKKSRWAFLWTILAVLFAVLAGLTGSALVASMIALILSSIVVLRSALGGGAGAGFGFGLSAPPSGFGYALPVPPTANGRITAYDMNPEVYMDDNSQSAAGAPLMYAAYARQSNPPVNISKPFRPTK